MKFEQFQQLSVESIRQLIQSMGNKVCVFPINGTRRWFLLEHGRHVHHEDYLDITWRRQLELYQLFFEHGIHTLLNPIFGPDLWQRGEAYEQLILPGLLWFTQNKRMFDFCEKYGVRVRTYGDTERYLQDTAYAPLLDAFAEITERTAHYQQHRLFFGVCAHDSAETVAQIGHHFYQKVGRLPSKREIVESYYGEYVEAVDIFIGFDRPTVFDMPLIATGEEDLYFTVAPSPYFNEKVLRAILYDHLFARRVDESYSHLSSSELEALAEFYRLNRNSVLGLGCRFAGGNFWYPTSQVKLPPSLRRH